MQKRIALKLIVSCALWAGATASFGQEAINIAELSGGGATASTNIKSGVELAVKEINGVGGILGKKIETTASDTQANPGVAKGLTRKVVAAALHGLNVAMAKA